MSNKIHMLNHASEQVRSYCGKNNSNIIIIEDDNEITCSVCSIAYKSPMNGVREKGLSVVNTFKIIAHYRAKGQYQARSHSTFNRDTFNYVKGILNNYYQIDSDYTTLSNILKYIRNYYAKRPYEFPSRRDIFNLVTERMLIG